MERNAIRRQILRGLRGLAWTVAVVAVLMVAFALWVAYLDRPPHFTITPPVLPAHNAADVYVRANRAMRHADELWRHCIIWREMADKDIALATPRREGAHPVAPSPLPMAVLLRDNAQALHMICNSRDLEFVVPLDPRETLTQYSRRKTEYWSSVRDCRHLLELHAFHKCQGSDRLAAVNALLDLIGFKPSNSFPIARTEQCTTLRTLAGNLSTADVRVLVTRLETVCRRQLSYAEALAWDKPFLLRDVLSSLEFRKSHRFRENNLLKFLVELSSFQMSVDSLRADYTVPDTQVPSRADRYLTACIRVAQQPLCTHAVYPKAPLDYVYSLNISDDDELALGQLYSVLWQFKLDGLLLSTALDGYQREHHRYPATLSELVSDGWIHRLPVDPFTQRDTFCYRRTATAFVLYSRGPDGRDDGGTPITNPVPHRFVVYLKSRGDVVYGVNQYGEN